MKRIISIILALVLLTGCFYIGASAEEAKELKLGDYITLGKYNGKDIVWRYVADDENGKLFWSNDSLCDKRFDVRFSKYEGDVYRISRNHWESSSIKKWLNSNADAEMIDTTLGGIYDPIYEKGFLHEDNFTVSEKLVIKTVALNNIVDNYYLKDRSKMVDRDILTAYFHSPISNEKVIEEFNRYPSETIIENVFLLDYKQLSQIERNKSILHDDKLAEFGAFWLRTPFIGRTWGGGGTSYTKIGVFYGYTNKDKETQKQTFIINFDDASYKLAIRPAFYLNEENAQILSGSGTKDDPYVLDGKPVPEMFEEDGLYGYKDADGNVIVPAKYLKAWEFSEGAALVVLPEDPYRLRYIDTTGNYLFDKAFYACNNFNNGYALVLVADDPKYSYIDKTGEAATELLFDDAEDFCGGYARVQIDGKWGVIDINLNFKVPCEYDDKDDVWSKINYINAT